MLLILAGVTISLAVSNQGIFSKAKKATGAYKNADEGEQTGLDAADKEIAKYMPGGTSEGESGSESGGGKSEGGSGSESGGGTSGSGSITYTDASGNTQPLTKDTAAGTKIGTTANISGKDGEAGVNLDWYLFDVSDDGKTAYLVSTPTYWVPDTTKEVSGAWVPKLVSAYDGKTGAIRQAIQKKGSGTAWDNYNYSSGNVTYKPSDNTLNYYKSANPQWNTNRGSTPFASMNENEQAACYLADGDIFAGIKSQVNNADGNLKGKIQTLVGGASAEQWANAYNNQKVIKDDPTKKITCEYQATNTPGYIYKVNGTAQNSGWYTNAKTIVGDEIYGGAYTNNHSDNSTYPFFSCWWWLASPFSYVDTDVCTVYSYNFCLNSNYSYYSGVKVSLFASVAL